MSNFFHSQRFCLARSQQVQKHGKLTRKLLKRKMESEILSQVVSLFKLIWVNQNFSVPVYKNLILWLVFSCFKIIHKPYCNLQNHNTIDRCWSSVSQGNILQTAESKCDFVYLPDKCQLFEIHFAILPGKAQVHQHWRCSVSFPQVKR